MILSSYSRASSPWVMIQHTGPDGGKKYVKTRIRKDDPEREKKVLLEMNRLQAKILKAEVGETGQRREGWNWVIPFLRTRYAASAKTKTLRIYLIQWRWLSEFLEEKEIGSPGALERGDVFEYIDWRRAQVKEKSRRNPGLNTALGEAKLLGLIMKEAIARGYAIENPATKLGVEKEDAAETAAMTDEEIAKIMEALATRPLWMRRAFELAYHTGLRFSSTQLTRNQVLWDREEIFIPSPKGGKKREFTIPLYPAAVPMLREWWESGEAKLWDLPPKERDLVGLEWTRFFREIGLRHLKFHSTRTTFITRGALGDAKRGIAPIPEPVMMKLVNHGAREVHRIYQRFTTADLRPFVLRMPSPELARGHSSSGAKSENPSRKTSH